MSLFTEIRNFADAPRKSFEAFDPILHKLTTGHFNLSVASYKARTAAGVHELYSQDRLAQKLGIKESSVTKVAVVAGVIVATYFTAGAASGAFSGGAAGAGAGAGEAGAAAGAGGGITAGEVYEGVSVASALQKAAQSKKASDAAAAQQDQAQANAATALQNQATVQGAAQPGQGLTIGHILTIAAIAASVL